MTSWILLPSLLVAVAVLLIAWGLLRRLRSKRRGLRLRLISGHSSLLGDEIDRRAASLEELDTAGLDAAREKAEAGLNDLHADLLDRQAHLQNYEDLAFLQGQKLAVLARALAEAQSAASESSGAGAHSGAASPSSPMPTGSETPHEHRDRIESDLLQRIDDLRGTSDGDGTGDK